MTRRGHLAAQSMLLTKVLAGKGARDDVAVPIRSDLIADEDAPFERDAF